MRTNTGGVIAPNEVVGRDKLIARLWEILETQSVVMSAERRIGKSSVIRKMCAEAPEGILPLYRDLEGIRSPLEFVESVCRDSCALLGNLKRAEKSATAWFEKLGGIEIGGVIKLPESMTPHWKQLLEKTMADLMQDQDKTVVFFWDELPMMLHDIAESSGETVAMELLDTLRALRQTYHKRLRMVFTGSIGLHHISARLSEAGHINPATNDMFPLEAPPLDPEDAQDLALQLVQGEGLRSTKAQETAQCIAQLADNIPFYIHHIISAMKYQGDMASKELAEAIVDQALVAANDTWHLEHYVKRVGLYYGPDRKPAVLAILDELAAETGALGVDALQERLKVKPFPETSQTGASLFAGDREILLGLLLLLQKDHYIMKLPGDGAYAFRFSLIKRWWKISRGLG